MTKPLPSLSNFTKLGILSLPRIVLVGNLYSDNHDPGNECAVVDFSLTRNEAVVGYQADVDSAAWVQGAFKHKAGSIPKWLYIGLAFRGERVPMLSDRFEDEA
jgi:hypothetical protein